MRPGGWMAPGSRLPQHASVAGMGGAYRGGRPSSACYAPLLICRCIKRCFCLTSVCLTSVAYIGPHSRRDRSRKTKIGTEVAHVTRDSDTTSRVKRSKVKVTRPLYSPPCWRVRQLQRWAWERVGREKLLLRCRLLGRARRFGAHGREERGGGDISWRPPAYSLFQTATNRSASSVQPVSRLARFTSLSEVQVPRNELIRDYCPLAVYLVITRRS